MSATAHCSECDAEIALDGVVQGEIIVCAECGVDLEVISLDQPTLELDQMEQEEWGE